MPDIEQRVAGKVLIINKRNEVLLLRKSTDNIRHAGQSGRYNLPGGKLEPGESLHDALRREVYEETGLKITSVVPRPIFAGEWRPVLNETPHQIIGVFFVCPQWSGTVVLNDEHDAHEWVGRASLKTYDILPPEDEAILAYFTGMQLSE
jgi:8-oxo-dGTP diphosphatase